MVDNSEKFYMDLQEAIDGVPKEDMIVLMGDFNARISQPQHSTTSRIVGPFTVDVQNENGERLIDFCTTNNLVVSNSFFQHKSVHQTSWMHPGTKKWHLLDYTLVNRKFRSSVEDVRFYRKASGSIGTDHHLMRSKIKLHLKSRKNNKNHNEFRLGCTKLNDERVVDKFQKDILKKFEETKYIDVDVNVKYETLVQSLKENANKHLKLEKNNHQRQKEWLTKEILDAVENKSTTYFKWQQHRGSIMEQKYRKNYITQRKLVKILIDKRQTEYWDELSIYIESAIKQHDPATAYTMIRRLRGGRQSVEDMPIHNKYGTLLLNSNDRLERWKEFYSELLNVNSIIEPTLLDQIKPASLSTMEQHRQDKEPTLDEVQQALQQMKNRKAPGKDNVTAELLKAGGIPVIKWLHEIFVDIWKNEQMVADWTLAIIIRLYKNKGDKKICDNYRGISLLVVASKIFTRVILNRIQLLIDKQLLEEQAGFRTNRSTIDQVFILKMVMEKTREFNKSLHMCFIDIQKAYDSINRDLLWKICRQYGLTEKTVQMLKLVYKNTRAQVRINGELSEVFDIETGVMQGGIPSPVLFNIVFDFIIKKVLEQCSVEGVTFAYGSTDFYHGARDKFENFDILALMYADDLVALTQTLDDLKLFIKIFENVTQAYGLTMSVKKTCVMSIQQFKEGINGKIVKNQEVDIPDIEIIIRNQKIETVDSFSYLGCWVCRDQRPDKEIESRLTKSATAFNMLRNVIWYRKTISIEAKLRIFRACVLPVLLYGSEVWSLTAVQENRISTFYMKCLRTILGLNMGDHVANITIMQLSGQPSIENLMRRNRLRWFGHANRMENENGPHLVKKIMFSYFPGEKRPTNTGIRKRWENKIMDDIEKFDIKNWRKDTKDKDRWREIINRHVTMNPVPSNIKSIIQEFKDLSKKRRAEELAISHGKPQRKATEVLVKDCHNRYDCPNCKKKFKPQGTTGHIRVCATHWCKKNNIKIWKK
ncbi:unnamed protein product [Rotaria magnacalcarata]|uniref:Reverse transcriptase domain-containing protein n=1 Tax=Rotaria magnacalcarata TaxID=392030 RepID=A0A815H9N0_9BILA|nr:unnamed protein product [Rotaria magnacalcarata]